VGHWDQGTEEEDHWTYWPDVWKGKGVGHGATSRTLLWTFILGWKEEEKNTQAHTQVEFHGSDFSQEIKNSSNDQRIKN